MTRAGQTIYGFSNEGRLAPSSNGVAKGLFVSPHRSATSLRRPSSSRRTSNKSPQERLEGVDSLRGSIDIPIHGDLLY